MELSYPTPTNPLILALPGHVPSLKNRRKPAMEEGQLKFKKNYEVKQYLSRATPLLQQQTASQSAMNGWVFPVGYLTRIAVYTEIVFYRASPNTLPASDGDNAYTTLQELLQHLLIENDKQVGLGLFQVKYTTQKTLEQSKMWVWKLDDPTTQLIEFLEWRSANRHIDNPSEANTVRVPTILRAAFDSLEEG